MILRLQTMADLVVDGYSTSSISYLAKINGFNMFYCVTVQYI